MPDDPRNQAFKEGCLAAADWGDHDDLNEPAIDTVWVTTDKDTFPFGEVITFNMEQL